MKRVPVITCVVITLLLTYSLNRSWDFGNPIPPLGKFLDPFHGFWQNAERNTPHNQTIDIAGLQAPVTILYDSDYIPHVFAANEHDLFFAQGYLTARDRLWQMEFQTLAAAGRISEILGPKAINYDRGQRRNGMTFGAINTLEALAKDPPVHEALESYTAGVNAYSTRLRYEDFPIEYKLLDYAPEPWTELKVGLFFMNMAQTLNKGESDFQRTNALKLFGKKTLDILYPDRELSESVIADNPGQWKFTPRTISDSIPLALPAELIRLETDKKQRGVGSNDWVVSGTRTSTGSPILCNDPHLTLSMPSIWHIIHLNAPGVNVMGAAFPGSPCVILGFNDSIAWGATNAQRDLVDWYKIKFRDASKNEYLSDGEWKKSKKVIERIKVKGASDFVDTVVYTHHGPVVYDESFHGENEKNHFALRWLAHDGSEPLRTFYLLDRAHNFNEFSEALNGYAGPAQNFVFGSVSGDIAVRVQGKFPVRRRDEGKFVLDGTRTSTEWKAFIPDEQNAMIRNPARGYLFSANQYPTDSTYPYYIQSGVYYETYRNRRIDQVLGRLPHASPQDMMRLHNDNFNWQAFESVPAFLAMIDRTKLSGEAAVIYDSLKRWDFFNSIESEAAIYYQLWWRELYPMIWDEMTEAKVALDFPSEYTTIRLIREQPGFSYFDILKSPEVETARDVVQRSFEQAVRKAVEWKTAHAATKFRWADFKDTYIQHLLRVPAFSDHVVNGGYESIVNASSHTHGPSWRMIVSLEKTGVKAWGVYPGGQSGNPGSGYYNNMTGRWATGGYLKLHFVKSKDELRGKSLFSITLNPK